MTGKCLKSKYGTLWMLAFFLALNGCATTAPDQSEIDQQEANSHIELANQQIQLGNRQSALAHYHQALALAPSAELWYRIGRLHLLGGEEYQAMSVFGNALNYDAEHVPTLEQVGLLYLKWQQPEPAEAALTKAVDLDPTLWRALNGLAVIADFEERFDVAQVNYERALALQPESPDVLNNYGYSMYVAGRVDGARAHLTNAISLRNDHRLAWVNLAKVYAKEGDYAAAFNILRRTHSIPVAYHDIGYLASLNGDFSRAENFLSKALEESPRHFDAAYRNRATARNRMIGNGEGAFINRDDADLPYCLVMETSVC